MYNYKTNVSIAITIVICYLIYYIIFNNDNKSSQIEDLYQTNNFDDIQGPIDNISPFQEKIRNILTNKINNLKIVELEKDDNIQTITHFNISQNSIPIGTIRYFFPYVFNHNSNSHPSNQNCWLFCNGASIEETQYPELFKIVTKLAREPRPRMTFNLPNLVGRFINTSGTISSLSSEAPFMDYSNTAIDYSQRQNHYGIWGWDNKAIRILEDKNIKIENRDTSGYDHCDKEVAIRTTNQNVPWWDRLCSGNQNKNNMPPFLALLPYIKAKNINYKFKF